VPAWPVCDARVCWRTPGDVRVWEQDGGRVRTDVIDGFLCDRGFQCVEPGSPGIAADCRHRLRSTCGRLLPGWRSDASPIPHYWCIRWANPCARQRCWRPVLFGPLTCTRFAKGGFDPDITDPVNEIGLRRTTGVRPYDAELHKNWWARTVSNRRPLVCKTEPDCLPRFMRCHSVFKCAGQRLVRVHCVHRVSGCFCLSWHTLGTTGVWSSGVRSRLRGGLGFTVPETHDSTTC
jgi:hypothetical protein